MTQLPVVPDQKPGAGLKPVPYGSEQSVLQGRRPGSPGGGARHEDH